MTGPRHISKPTALAAIALARVTAPTRSITPMNDEGPRRALLSHRHQVERVMGIEVTPIRCIHLLDQSVTASVAPACNGRVTELLPSTIKRPQVKFHVQSACRWRSPRPADRTLSGG